MNNGSKNDFYERVKGVWKGLAGTAKSCRDWLKKWLKRWGEFAVGVVQTAVITVAVSAPLFKDETWFQRSFAGVNFLGIRDFLCVQTYAQAWEVFALAGSAILVLIYWVHQMFECAEYRSRACYAGLNLCLGVSGLLLLISVLYIKRDEITHFRYVMAVAALFSVGDLLTCIGAKDLAKRTIAREFLFLADLPVLVPLILLFIFMSRYDGTHPVSGNGSNRYEYFLPGAIAFQFIASNIIFVTLSWLKFDRSVFKSGEAS